MPINVRLDVLLAERKMKLSELAEAVGITLPNLSILKTGKAKAIRLSTLEAICKHLSCQPGDLLQYLPGPDEPGESDNEPGDESGEGLDEAEESATIAARAGGGRRG